MSANLKEKLPGKPHEKHYDNPHPKPHEKKSHKKGAGVGLTGIPEEMINLMLSSPADRQWALDQLTEGPDHKQVQSSLLLKSAFRLVKEIEKLTGKRLALQPGETLVTGKHGRSIPVALPGTATGPTQQSAIMEILAHAPEHEILVFFTLLQSMEWAIKTLTGSAPIHN